MRRVVGLILVMAVVLLARPDSASAHASLTQSTPADGSTLEQAPVSITLTFNENVLVHAASITLRSGHGELLARTGSGPTALQIGGPESGKDLVVRLPPLDKGTFGLTWQVKSADDLHRTSGTLIFGVGERVTPGGIDRWGPAPAVRSSALRWLDLLTLALLLGATLLLTVVAPRVRFDIRDRRRVDALLLSIAALAASATAVIGIVVLVDASGGLQQVGTIVSSSLFGRLWLLRELSLVTVAVLAAAAVPGRRAISRGLVGALALLASLVALAGSSHVGLGGGRPTAVVLLTLHLAAGGAWVGALVILSVLPRILRRGGAAIPARPILRAFGLPATVCVAVVATTGIALTGRQVASLDALLTTAYGQVLLAKIALVSVAGLLGLGATVRLRRRRTASTVSLKRGVWLESAILVAVLAAAAALSVGTPPRGPAFARTVHAQQPKLAAQVADLFETLDLAPNTVGQSWLRVTVDQTRRPAPGPVTGVSAALTGPDGSSSVLRNMTASELANHWQLSGVNLTAAGRWHISVAVHRTGRPDVVWESTWTVSGGPLGARQPIISDRAWGSLLDGLAVAVAVLLGLLALGLLRARRRPVESVQELESSADAERAMLEPVS